MSKSLHELRDDGEAATGSTVLGLPHGEAAVVCRTRPDGNGPNEDAAGVFTLSCGTAVLAIADGMGGGRAGHVASAMVIDSLSDQLDESSEDDAGVRTAILNALEQANRQIISMGLGAATTAAIVEVTPEALRPYHVGDSMILLTGQRGKVKLKTVMHSPVGFASESGILDDEQAMHHDERHVVSNAVGMTDMSMEVGSLTPIASRDTLVMGTDGLFDNLSVDEVVDTVRRGPIGQAADGLAQLAHERMVAPTPDSPSKPDDLSIIVYRPHPPRRDDRSTRRA